MWDERYSTDEYAYGKKNKGRTTNSSERTLAKHSICCSRTTSQP